jgi:hypothetical protein
MHTVLVLISCNTLAVAVELLLHLYFCVRARETRRVFVVGIFPKGPSVSTERMWQRHGVKHYDCVNFRFSQLWTLRSLSCSVSSEETIFMTS